MIVSVLMLIALIFMSFGVIGIFRFRNFYSRTLVTAKSETVGFLTMMIAVMISSGMSFFTLKVGLITIFVMMTNPIVTHSIARSAHHSGYQIRKDDAND
ncbi:MAG: monovalent cation/H(+) antiporter subunit G [Clostridiales bacterium]|nr:monovalent cation/H(+) antiporter subunit G [Clostridiales bacterium]